MFVGGNMEAESEFVYYADIANLKEALSLHGSSVDINDGIEELENDIGISDEENAENCDNVWGLPQPNFDLDEVELDENSRSPRTCRTLGTASYDVLYIIEKRLVTLLEKCQAKIKDVETRISLSKFPSDKPSMSRGSWYYMFGIPYFKDKSYFPCPPNEDHLEKTANKELSIVDLPPIRQWKPKDKMKLEAAVRAQEIANQVKKVEGKKATILKTLKEIDDSSKRAEIESKLEECDSSIIKTKTTAELVGIKKSEYDWMKISAIDLEGFHSPEECRAMWHNYLHPMIRKSKWTKDEDHKLKELVDKYDNQNWDAIAQELNTQRSGYQCMCQYQTRLNDTLRKSKWTKEEDDYLKEVVQRCRIGSYIPWAKVTYYMNGRSKNQVFNRWAYSLDPDIKRGRFTDEEDILIVAAVRRYGTDFPRVARFLPGRTSIQVRDRYNTFLKNQGTGEPWTPSDDNLLLSLVETHGEGNWSKISQHFINRTRTQLRHRYSTLQCWRRKVPEDKLQMVAAPTRRLNIEVNREEKVWSRVQAILRGMKTGTEMDENNLIKLKEKLHLDVKKRPGRKLGQKKLISALEKQYYSFFRCVYAQRGGRKKLRYDSDDVQSSSQVVHCMLKHLRACVEFPKDNSKIVEDNLLQETDKYLIQHLRDARWTEASDGNQNALWVPNTSELACTTQQDLHENASKISYLCPPNHTTLVGFRTLLLSRRNITKYTDVSEGTEAVTRYKDDGAPSPKQITPDMAVSLWKERLTSLFAWPAVMSNTVPKAVDCIFANDTALPATSCSQDPVEQTNETAEPRSSKKHGKKRINKVKKKKDADVVPLQKRRKYEKTGKFKKPCDTTVVRRSSRHLSIPAPEVL